MKKNNKKTVVGKMVHATIEVPVLSEAMIKSGIIAFISSKQTNGSYLCMVDLNKVQRDDNINPRQISKAHVAEIVMDFNQDCFDSPKLAFKSNADGLTVTHAQASAWILAHINGQHSIASALRVGLPVVSCQVWFDRTDAELARIFYQAAIKTKRMNTWTSFKAALRAGDNFAMSIKKAIDAYEFTTTADVGKRADLTNYAPLDEAVKLSETMPATLDRFLDVLTVFRDDNNHLSHKIVRKGEFQRGLLDFLVNNFDVSQTKIKRLLSEWSPDYFDALAGGAAQTAGAEKNRGYYRDAFATVLKTKAKRK